MTLTGAAVNGMSMTVVYDETRLTLTGVSGGWTLSGNTVSTDSAVSAGTAVTLTFTVATDEGNFVNPGDAAISIVGQTAGKVVITLAGDLNGDGRVNARDALLCLKKASGESVNIITGSADLNADGRVNARDALLCLKKASGESVVVY